MPSPRRARPALCAIGLAAGLLASSGLAHAADASSPVAWTQVIQGNQAGRVDPEAAILSHPNGDVTFGGCTQAQPKEAIETWTSTHSLVGSRPVSASPDPFLCDASGVTDLQGNIYALTQLLPPDSTS